MPQSGTSEMVATDELTSAGHAFQKKIRGLERETDLPIITESKIKLG